MSQHLPLRERQRDFVAALLDPDRAVPFGVVGPDGLPSAKRFAVYRNNVVAGLVDTLKVAFPAVARLVGGEFFAAMARIYVAREPPKSPIMLDYGASFGDFIETFEPARPAPYLGDVARLERAWVEAYHAAEAAPVQTDRLAGLCPHDLASMKLILHPSARVLRSRFPVVAIWRMNIEGGEPGPIDLDGGEEYALVARPAAEVEVRRISADTAVFIRALAEGAAVADAAGRSLRMNVEFDLAEVLGCLLRTGSIVGWALADDANRPRLPRSI
jgi:hypothetical protein